MSTNILKLNESKTEIILFASCCKQDTVKSITSSLVTVSYFKHKYHEPRGVL